MSQTIHGHTPGPWLIEDNVLKAQDGERRKHLFVLEEMPGLGTEAEANLKLLAAVPEIFRILNETAGRLAAMKRASFRAYAKPKDFVREWWGDGLLHDIQEILDLCR